MDNLEAKAKELKEKIAYAGSIETLEQIRIETLGRNGIVTEVLRGLSALPIEERKTAGERANRLKKEFEELIGARIQELKSRFISRALASEKDDISPAFAFPFDRGHGNPLRQTLLEITEIFKSLGFSVVEGPEIETDWYNFEALNIPKDHPARDIQDTFYLEGSDKLLRTHTSPVQIHVMEKQKPPLRVIVPGRVYRNEATDSSHSAIFHQVEGLAVGENITFADLKGTLTLFVQKLFGKNTKLRFRPSYFQFTEPSGELDVSCFICGGKGCRVCKNSGWLEMLGCGMVHPNVFKAVKYDPLIYSGYAFGLGVERFAMLMYGIDDMRLFYENNLRFLRQF